MCLCLQERDDQIDINKSGAAADLTCKNLEQECTAPKDRITQAGGEMHAVKEQDDTPDFTLKQTTSLPMPNRTELTATENSLEDHLSPPISHVSGVLSENKKDILVDKKSRCTPDTIMDSVMEEKADEDDLKQQEGSVTNKSKDRAHMEKEGTTVFTTFINKSLNECGCESETNIVEKADSTVVPSKSESKKEITVGENILCTTDTIVDPVMKEIADEAILKPQEEYAIINESEDKIIMEKEGETLLLKESFKDVMVTVRLNEGNPENVVSINQPSKSLPTELPVSKEKIQLEFESTEVNFGLRQHKVKIYTKSQTERHMESGEQFVVPPIIILPDTRETVIKNVAKMRSTAPTPEIKVTEKVPEKVKHEESNNDLVTDLFITEHDKLTQPLKDKSSQQDKQLVNVTITPNDIKDNIVIITESVGTTPIQQDRNADEIQSVKPHNMEAIVCNKDEPGKINSGWNRGNGSNSIPTINIACADEVTSSNEHEKEVIHATIHRDNVNRIQTLPPNPTTHVESLAEQKQKKATTPESLVNMLRKAVSNLDSEVSPDTGKYENAAFRMSERENLTGIQPSSVKTQNLSGTETDKVCTDQEIKMETEADKLQKDKPAMEKLGLTTPVGPTLPPLSPASLRRLMAKNNPNLESHASTSASGDGNEKKGEDSGGSTPTSTLSCESSPKMKRRDSLTLIPSATPEELASGARRKIYLAKTKSEDEGSDSQNKRDSPYMSPSQARRAALLQLQSEQQTPPMEKRSPLLPRRKTTLEVPKTKEEVSDEIIKPNTDNKPEEKEKLDPFKGKLL